MQNFKYFLSSKHAKPRHITTLHIMSRPKVPFDLKSLTNKLNSHQPQIFYAVRKIAEILERAAEQSSDMPQQSASLQKNKMKSSGRNKKKKPKMFAEYCRTLLLLLAY